MALSFAIIYFFYRHEPNVWSFTKFEVLESFAYADILAIMSMVYFIVSFVPFFLSSKQHQIKTVAFFDDEPVSENKPDELGYESYAKEIVDRIEGTSIKKSFAIGINGPWGVGKTSFINLMKKNLKLENKIIVDFNPWSNETSELIIKDFFENLQNEIRPFYSSLADQLVNYSDKLSVGSKNHLSRAFETLKTIDSIGSPGSHDLYTEINSELLNLNKKVIVFIDDLDRLDKSELLSVIRLIRNTANFHNTFFIVAYDRNYILTAIKDHNPSNNHLFLEKIFQIEINLPSFNRKILRQKLAEKLMSVVSTDYHKEISQTVFGDGATQPIHLDSWITSLRDVTRLANSLSINFLNLQGEVNFDDFLNLELLRLKYPSVYELLFRDTKSFLKVEVDGHQKHVYCLKTIGEKQTNSFLTTDLSSYSISKYLKDNDDMLSVPKNEIIKILGLLSIIFPNQNSTYKRVNNLSVVYPSNFDKYFSYALSSSNLSAIEFSLYRNRSSQELNNKITHWINQGLEFELQRKFQEINDYDDRQDFEKIVLGIFHLANHEPHLEKTYRSIVGFDTGNLKNKLYDYDNRTSNSYYSDNGGRDGLRSFILDTFNSAKSPFEYESFFIAGLLKHYPENFPISKDKLESIVVGYFKSFCQSSQTITQTTWQLFNRCKTRDWESKGGTQHSKKELFLDDGVKALKNFVFQKDLNGFLIDIIDANIYRENLYGIWDKVPEIFGSWDALRLELEKHKKTWSYVPEFLSFFDEFAKTSFSSYVKFNFVVIDLKKKFQ
ncbi:KAP family P-loop NTPase fold protein [Roseivirga seohaensis]|uniref:KAP family P-loop NTPase fold protein n=1 Tax=Roseivirga seohaensis TaxID=1914963 RepID=UPI003BADB92E